jgi:hypothetical protein
MIRETGNYWEHFSRTLLNSVMNDFMSSLTHSSFYYGCLKQLHKEKLWHRTSEASIKYSLNDSIQSPNRLFSWRQPMFFLTVFVDYLSPSFPLKGNEWCSPGDITTEEIDNRFLETHLYLIHEWITGRRKCCRKWGCHAVFPDLS